MLIVEAKRGFLVGGTGSLPQRARSTDITLRKPAGNGSIHGVRYAKPGKCVKEMLPRIGQALGSCCHCRDRTLCWTEHRKIARKGRGVLDLEIHADIIVPSQDGILLRRGIKTQDPKGVSGQSRYQGVGRPR
jgi:hypothetical protein